MHGGDTRVAIRAKHGFDKKKTEFMAEIYGFMPPPWASIREWIGLSLVEFGFGGYMDAAFTSIRLSVATNYQTNGHLLDFGDTICFSFLPLRMPGETLKTEALEDYYGTCLQQYITFHMGTHYVQSVPEIRLDLKFKAEEFYNNGCSCGKVTCHGLSRFFRKPGCENF